MTSPRFAVPAFAVLAACGASQRPARDVARDVAALREIDAPAFARHARIQTIGNLWLGVHDEPARATVADAGCWRPVVPVIAEQAGRVRIVIDDDGARIAAWVGKATLAQTIAVPIALAADGSDGAWLEPGADLESGSGADGVAMHGGELTITGNVAPDALVAIWSGDVPVTQTEHALALDTGAQIFAAPAPGDAQPIAVAHAQLGAALVADRGDWIEIDLAYRGARVRGFVAARDVDRESYGEIDSGLMSTWGMSDIGKRVIPAGACLYDREDGEVVGVTRDARERYAFDSPHRGWVLAYIGMTYWAPVLVAVKLTDRGAEPCAP